ncbi:hypothetical protein CSV61_02055 [Sporosarcina sp. P3]|uniref:hypothetical protein n=1 Tax=Sporosarcina sp. P3 TaxID=2048245 RepID=UPI000C170B72|nr:hypothetical protein [Sporosarcina sp. P3]PID23252.1 hypothetical protein CSV61_02055 [Sporosarcina sp. P3]
MKKVFTLFLMTSMLAACGSEKVKDEPEISPDSEEVLDEIEVNEVEEPTSNLEEISTDIFKYATDVKVTDAIDINQYVSIIVHMDNTDNEGMAFQHVVNQTYDFLQQPALKEADKVGVNVVIVDRKIGMFEVDTAKFIPNDDVPMSDAVMVASEIEMISPEVKEFGEIMGSW